VPEGKYSIEEVSERLGVTPRTLHYYEEIGLLENVPRTEGGHRYYDERILSRLEHILKLKHLLGISLQEIRGILDAEKELERIRASYYEESHSDQEKEQLLDQAVSLLQEQIGHIDDKIRNLQVMRQGFEQRLERAQRLKKGSLGKQKI
jgi:DNA-binding transcriptional MerR regulator